MRQRTSLKSFTYGASLKGSGPYGGQVDLTVPRGGFLNGSISFGGAKALDNDGTEKRHWLPGRYTFNVAQDGKTARLAAFVPFAGKVES